MKFLLKTVSFVALTTLIIPPFIYFTGDLSKDAMKTLMLMGTLAWFITAPFWMGLQKEQKS
jgi:hypothetical protein